MRAVLAVLFVLAFAPVNAALVTFEEFSALSGQNVGSVSSGGFTFVGEHSLLVLDEDPSDGTFVWAVNAPGSTTTMTISRDDGAAFDLHSLDLQGFGGDFTILGYNALNELVAMAEPFPADWSTIGFNGAWNNISTLVIEDSVFSFGALMPTTAGIRLDNFSATAVPLPAAVWLFGSALAGLGWRSRKT